MRGVPDEAGKPGTLPSEHIELKMLLEHAFKRIDHLQSQLEPAPFNPIQGRRKNMIADFPPGDMSRDLTAQT